MVLVPRSGRLWPAGRGKPGDPAARLRERDRPSQDPRVVVERAFDRNFSPRCRQVGAHDRSGGFHNREPRLLLGDDRFTWVVDGGLGTGTVEYLDIVVNTFPSREAPGVAFPPARPAATPRPIRGPDSPFRPGPRMRLCGAASSPSPK